MDREPVLSGKEYRSFIREKKLFLLGLALATVAVFILSIALGSSNLPLGKVLAALAGRAEGKEKIIVSNLRLPRSATAVVVGVGLGIVGCVMQGVLRNPLASSGTVGVSQGASFGAAFAIIVLGGGAMSSNTAGATLSVINPALVSTCAFLGAISCTVVVVILAQLSRSNPGTLILAGVALSNLFGAATTLMQYFADDVKVAAVVYWTFGNLGSTFWKDIAIMAAAVVIALVFFWLNSWNYNAMQSGEDTAKGLGVNTRQITIWSMAVGALTAAVIVSFIGIINFVGLIAPHLVRRFVGTDYRYLIPASGLAGACLLLLSDTFARIVVAPIVLPVGAITSALGAPLFLWIVFKGGIRRK
ncbi:MAG: iron ABC transporter permease [Oscillospiraceae bacterium]|nr:iron ABC transporter permease [Oscillospiraceae bacterium]